MKTFYQVLGVAEKASQAEIKKAFVSAIRDLHPDKVQQSGGNANEHLKKAQEVNEAFTTLKDPDKRAEYDRYELPKVKQKQAEAAEAGNENQSFDIPSAPSMEKNESQEKQEESKAPEPKPSDKKDDKEDKDDDEEEEEKKKKGGDKQKTPNIFRDFEGGVKKADAFVSKIFASPEMEKNGFADKDKDKGNEAKKENDKDLPYKRFGLGM